MSSSSASPERKKKRKIGITTHLDRWQRHLACGWECRTARAAADIYPYYRPAVFARFSRGPPPSRCPGKMKNDDDYAANRGCLHLKHTAWLFLSNVFFCDELLERQQLKPFFFFTVLVGRDEILSPRFLILISASLFSEPTCHTRRTPRRALMMMMIVYIILIFNFIFIPLPRHSLCGLLLALLQ